MHMSQVAHGVRELQFCCRAVQTNNKTTKQAYLRPSLIAISILPVLSSLFRSLYRHTGLALVVGRAMPLLVVDKYGLCPC